MKNLFHRCLLFAFIAVFVAGFTSCRKREEIRVEGMAPIYVDPLDKSLIYREDPREFENLGIIVKVGKYLFINERLKGIHVLDNSDPKNPVRKHFWRIPGNTRFTIDGDVLYADNSVHLLTIDISDYSRIRVVHINEDIYEPDEIFRPELGYRGPFECVDLTKGAFVGWEKRELVNPKCEAL